MENQSQSKRCPKCGETKPFSEFWHTKIRKDGLEVWCKVCKNKAVRKYQKTHIEKLKITNQKWRESHKEVTNIAARERRRANPERYKEYDRQWRKNNSEKAAQARHKYQKANIERCREFSRQWRKRNLEYARKQGRIYYRKLVSTTKGVLDCRMHCAIYDSLRKRKDGHRWEVLVGYTIEDLKKHLEGLFLEGMSWENIGKWHIDHRVPLSRFHYEHPEEQEFRVCWSLSNLQPMWACDNLSKNDKTPEEWEKYKTQRAAI